MTIDEAIAQEREVANQKYAEGMLCHANPNDEKLDGCIKCAEEHEQIAEWLEELKELRNMTTGHLYAVAFNMGYLKAEKEARNKAIDDFKSRLEERILAGKMIDEKFAYIDNCDIDEISEQLKAGGWNEVEK